jgi:hypothetical protein
VSFSLSISHSRASFCTCTASLFSIKHYVVKTDRFCFTFRFRWCDALQKSKCTYEFVETTYNNLLSTKSKITLFYKRLTSTSQFTLKWSGQFSQMMRKLQHYAPTRDTSLQVITKCMIS